MIERISDVIFSNRLVGHRTHRFPRRTALIYGSLGSDVVT